MQADSQTLPSSSMPGQSIQTALQASSQYAAPTSQEMHTDNIISKVKIEPLEEQQEDQAVRVLPKVVARPVPTAEAKAGGTHKQSSLGKQLGDALRLRKCKGLEAASKEPDPVPSSANQATPSQVPQAAQTTDAMVLSPRTESALLIAASELGFDAEQASPDLQSGSRRLTAAAQPPCDPASASRSVRQCLTSASTYLCSNACQSRPTTTRTFKIKCCLEEEEGFPSSANQLYHTDVPGLSMIWSKIVVPSNFHLNLWLKSTCPRTCQVESLHLVLAGWNKRCHQALLQLIDQFSLQPQ